MFSWPIVDIREISAKLAEAAELTNMEVVAIMPPEPPAEVPAITPRERPLKKRKRVDEEEEKISPDSPSSPPQLI